jgi:hypothetical protein
MSDTAILSPELSRSLSALARNLVSAVRARQLYSPEHPAAIAALERLGQALKATMLGQSFTVGVTPEDLLVDGAAVTVRDHGIAEAATLLHDRDVIQVHFSGTVPPSGLLALVSLLSQDIEGVRQRGGPSRVWQQEGDPAIIIDQVDYQEILADHERAKPVERRDDVWTLIVKSLVVGRPTFDELAQQRLLEIAGDPEAIATLATDVMASKCTPDGSPMIASQAAAVVATFRHLASVVHVLAPDRAAEVTRNLTTALFNIEPHVMIEMMRTFDGRPDETSVMAQIASNLEDVHASELLARALSKDGQATDRLAQVFDTIAPDKDRKLRILKLTRSMMRESDFGKSTRFETLWTSMEELLLGYGEKQYVSDGYRSTLDGAIGRATELGGKLPTETPEWLKSVEQESVTHLSVLLMTDLLTLEREPGKAADIARDIVVLGETLVMSGDFEDGCLVARALADAKSTCAAPDVPALEEARLSFARSRAVAESIKLMGALDEAGYRSFAKFVDAVGPACLEAFRSVLHENEESLTFRRARDTVMKFGVAAVPLAASLLQEGSWPIRRNGIRLLGRLGTADAVAALQPLLRDKEATVVHEAVAAVARIDEPSAARAIGLVLRTAAGELRETVVAALVAGRDRKVVPLLVRMLRETFPLGSDHRLVLETLKALGIIGDDQAVPVVASIAQQRRLLSPFRSLALKRTAVGALERIGTASAATVLASAAERGDWMLRRAAAPAAARMRRMGSGDSGAGVGLPERNL